MDDLIIWQEIMTSASDPEEFTIVPRMVVSDIMTDVTIIYQDVDFKNECNEIMLDKNFSILYSINTIVQEIYESYAGRNILNQFRIDFPRMHFYLNTTRCKNMADFLGYIEKFRKYTYPIVGNVCDLVLMLTTQSSFFYPFSIVHRLYSKPDSDIYVLADSDTPYVNIVNNQTSLDIIFKKTFKYMNIETNEIQNRFHTVMVLTINLVHQSPSYEAGTRYYGYAEIGIINWIKEKVGINQLVG